MQSILESRVLCCIEITKRPKNYIAVFKENRKQKVPEGSKRINVTFPLACFALLALFSYNKIEVTNVIQVILRNLYFRHERYHFRVLKTLQRFYAYHHIKH